MTILYEPLRRHAQEIGMLFGSDLHTVATPEDLVNTLVQRPDEMLVLFGPGTEVAEAAHFAAQQRVLRPALGVVLMRSNVDLSVLGEAMRAGVRDVVDAGDIAAVRNACLQSLNISRQLSGAGPTGPTKKGRVVTVFAAKGGCGKTTMATNLAIALAAGGQQRVCVIDLDLAFGDGQLDDTALASLVTSYAPGVDALLAPTRPTDGDHVSRGLVGELLNIARRMYDFVVVDTPPQFTDHVLAALDASDQFVLLATPDIPALKNLRITLDMFDLLDYPDDRRLVVLNRADAKVGLSGADIERIVRVPIAAHIPSSRDVPMSINRGVPLMTENPNHPASKAIRSLAASRISAPPASAAGSHGLRGLLGRRRSTPQKGEVR